MSDVIEFRGVAKRFAPDGDRAGFLAIENLTFAVSQGALVAVVGRTGCGKSTMFNLLAGLIAPTAGEVRVFGRDPFRDFQWLRGRLAIVFQGDRLMPWRTALENVELGLELLGHPATARRPHAQGWLAKLGLAGHEHDYPHALSGGMRQRVSIARAFAVDPEILLCDEPFSALDELTAQRLRAEYLQLVRENDKTSIFVTHSISEALQLGSRIIVFDRPARIALDVDVPPDLREAERESLRQRILEVLHVGAQEEREIA